MDRLFLNYSFEEIAEMIGLHVEFYNMLWVGDLGHFIGYQTGR